jgi:hypothetical protein
MKKNDDLTTEKSISEISKTLENDINDSTELTIFLFQSHLFFVITPTTAAATTTAAAATTTTTESYK